MVPENSEDGGDFCERDDTKWGKCLTIALHHNTGRYSEWCKCIAIIMHYLACWSEMWEERGNCIKPDDVEKKERAEPQNVM